MDKYLFLFFILFACSIHKGKSCFFYRRIHISVVNKLPNDSLPLSLHCKSRNDDLGNHTLTQNQDFNFSFYVIPIFTLFTCDLMWGDKTSRVDVYDATWLVDPCIKGQCLYEVYEIGTYINGERWGTWN
ncbi:hypothetical protein ABFS83_06G166900 [Erythranthe nasuta]